MTYVGLTPRKHEKPVWFLSPLSGYSILAYHISIFISSILFSRRADVMFT